MPIISVRNCPISFSGANLIRCFNYMRRICIVGGPGGPGGEASTFPARFIASVRFLRIARRPLSPAGQSVASFSASAGRALAEEMRNVHTHSFISFREAPERRNGRNVLPRAPPTNHYQTNPTVAPAPLPNCCKYFISICHANAANAEMVMLAIKIQRTTHQQPIHFTCARLPRRSDGHEQQKDNKNCFISATSTACRAKSV